MNFPEYKGDLVKYLAELRGMGFETQLQAARYFNVHPATISRHENGKVLAPWPYLHGMLQRVVERCETVEPLSVEERGQILQMVNQIIRDHYPNQAFFGEWEDLLAVEPQTRCEWTTAPNVSGFLGRRVELAQLGQWVLRDRSRLVAILGGAGNGKTTLATRYSQLVSNKFDAVLWKSLRNAPQPQEFLSECLQFLAGPHGSQPFKEWDQQVADLLACLRSQRCLMVIDNFESVLQEGEFSGAYREGYAAYGDLIRKVSAAQHISCLVLTSREQPREIAELEGISPMVKVLRLGGISLEDAQVMLQDRCLQGTPEQWKALVDHFLGNPKALQLVSGTISDLYSCDIARFLSADTPLFGDARELLAQQFRRLSKLEVDLMFWLAIEREAVRPKRLFELLLQDVSFGDVLEALHSLRQRFLLDSGPLGFSLQNLVMEYVTDRLVNQICFEVESGQLQYFNSHALARAQVKEFVRQTQFRLIVLPIAQRMLKRYGRTVDVQERVMHLLNTLRTAGRPQPGYGGGNALKLLRGLGADLRGADFSHLALWDVDSRDSGAVGANFSNSDLRRSVSVAVFSRVLSLAFSQDGAWLAVGTTGGEILIIQTSDFSTSFTCTGHTDWVRSLAFSADGSFLASASDDQTIRLWDLKTGQPIRVLSGHIGRVFNVSLHPHLPVLISSGDDRTIRFWNLEIGRCFQIWQAAHEKWIFSLVLRANGQELVSASSDQTIKIWDLSGLRVAYLNSNVPALAPQIPLQIEKHPSQVLVGHTSYVWSLALDQDDALLASGGHDGTVRLWDLAEGSPPKILEDHPGGIRSLAISPTQRILAVGCKGIVRLWDLDSGQMLKTIAAHSASVWGVVFSPDGRLLVSAGQDRTIRFWSARDYEAIFTLQGYCASITTLAFHPNRKILASGAEDRAIRLWDTESGTCLKVLAGHKDCPRTVVFSPDGKWLASKGEDLGVRIWDAGTGKILNSFVTGCIGHIQFSPDGQELIAACDHSVVRTWDLAGGQWARRFEEHGFETYSLAVSPDRRWLAAGCENDTVYLWDWASGQLKTTLQGHSNTVWSVAFRPDSACLISASADGTLRMWDVNTGQTLRVLTDHTDQVKFVAFSPRGDIFASAGYDHDLRLWDAQDGTCLAVLKGHTGALSSLVFDADGGLLASGSQDESIRIWDVTSRQCLRTLKAPRPYEGINIYGITGISETQKEKLKELGAVEIE